MGIVAIGQAVPRHEDPTLLKGEGSYTGDVSLPNQAYGYVLRSPHAHAKLVSIETGAAKAAVGAAGGVAGAVAGAAVTAVKAAGLLQEPQGLLWELQWPL